MAIWDELHKDIWWSIFKKLTLTDHISFSGVCRLWRSIGLEYRNTYIPTHVPGLIIPGISNSTSSQTRRFLAFPVGKKINYESQGAKEDLPELSIPHISHCCGSHQGWLVMIHDNDNTMNMYLQNPMSGVRIDLPSVTTLPEPSPGDTPISKWYVHQAFLSSSPSSLTNYDCFVLVFHGRGALAFCRVGDKAWKVIQGPETLGYIDAIFYKKKFFFTDESGRIYTVSKVDLTRKRVPIVRELALTSPRPFVNVEKCYLVECGGELFLIYRDVSCKDQEEDSDITTTDVPEFYTSDDDDDDDEFETTSQDVYDDVHEFDTVDDNEFETNLQDVYDDVSEFDSFDYDNNAVHRTYHFQVLKLHIGKGSDSKSKWVEVKDLDGGAIFLGYSQSFGLSNSNLMGYKGDRIYYTDDDCICHKVSERSGLDVGIYNLKDSKVEPLYVTDIESTQPPAVWITPMLW